MGYPITCLNTPPRSFSRDWHRFRAGASDFISEAPEGVKAALEKLPQDKYVFTNCNETEAEVLPLQALYNAPLRALLLLTAPYLVITASGGGVCVLVSPLALAAFSETMHVFEQQLLMATTILVSGYVGPLLRVQARSAKQPKTSACVRLTHLTGSTRCCWALGVNVYALATATTESPAHPILVLFLGR